MFRHDQWSLKYWVMRMFAVLLRALFVIAIGAIALIAIAAALIADASSIPAQRRRRNQTRIARNPREVSQSKIVFVEEIAS